MFWTVNVFLTFANGQYRAPISLNIRCNCIQKFTLSAVQNNILYLIPCVVLNKRLMDMAESEYLYRECIILSYRIETFDDPFNSLTFQ